MTPSFIPDDMDVKEPTIPWFEDSSQELGIKGHRTNKSIEELKTEIKAAMSKLGGGVTNFLTGRFETTPERYGYEVTFAYGNREGKIEVAALPIKKDTPSKRKQALKQALYTVREMLEAQFNSRFSTPGAAPLVPYLLDDKGMTLAENLSISANIPLLSPPIRPEPEEEGKKQDDEGDTVEGEFEEVEE